MARRIIEIGVALAAIGLATPVAAQSVDDDVRCLLASNAVARAEKEADKRQLAAVTSAFYLGRLDARISNDQLKSMVVAQAKIMTGQNVGPLINNCVKRVAQKGLALRTVPPSPNAPQPPRAPAKPK